MNLKLNLLLGDTLREFIEYAFSPSHSDSNVVVSLMEDALFAQSRIRIDTAGPHMFFVHLYAGMVVSGAYLPIRAVQPELVS